MAHNSKCFLKPYKKEDYIRNIACASTAIDKKTTDLCAIQNLTTKNRTLKIGGIQGWFYY